MKTKKAIITGITGQDGSYLAELLIEKVMKFMELEEDHLRLIHKESIIYTQIQTLKTKLFLHYGDMTDSSSLTRIIKKIQPDEIYNLVLNLMLLYLLKSLNILQIVMNWSIENA